MPRTAEHSFEVETDLSALFTRGDEYSPSGYVDDLEASGLYALKHSRENGKSRWTRVDLLAGLTPEARAIVEANVLSFIGETEAVEALAEAA